MLWLGGSLEERTFSRETNRKNETLIQVGNHQRSQEQFGDKSFELDAISCLYVYTFAF